MTEIKISEATYYLPTLDDAGEIVSPGYWTAHVVINSTAGTLSSTDRFDLPADATEADITAVVKDRAGAVPGKDKVIGAAKQLDPAAKDREAALIAEAQASDEEAPNP